MIGLTEEKAKEIFLKLWSQDEFDWDWEGTHFHDKCNSFGLDIVLEAQYQVLKARETGKVIRDEMQYFWGCCRHTQDKERERSSSIQKRASRGDDGGITPPGFDSYGAYWEYCLRKHQEEFPDSLEMATARAKEQRIVRPLNPTDEQEEAWHQRVMKHLDEKREHFFAVERMPGEN